MKYLLRLTQVVFVFLSEVELLAKVKHKNLVSLIGYCAEASKHDLKFFLFSLFLKSKILMMIN